MRIIKQHFKYFPMLKKRPFHKSKRKEETQQFQVKWTTESNNLCDLNIEMKLVCSWHWFQSTKADKVLRPHWLLKSSWEFYFPQKHHKYHTLNQCHHGRKLNPLMLLCEGLSQETPSWPVTCLSHIYWCSVSPIPTTFPSVSFASELKTQHLVSDAAVLWSVSILTSPIASLFGTHPSTLCHPTVCKLHTECAQRRTFLRGNNCILRNTHLSWLKSNSLNAARFVIAKDWKEPHCPPVEDLLNPIWTTMQ